MSGYFEILSQHFNTLLPETEKGGKKNPKKPKNHKTIMKKAKNGLSDQQECSMGNKKSTKGC